MTNVSGTGLALLPSKGKKCLSDSDHQLVPGWLGSTLTAPASCLMALSRPGYKEGGPKYREHKDAEMRAQESGGCNLQDKRTREETACQRKNSSNLQGVPLNFKDKVPILGNYQGKKQQLGIVVWTTPIVHIMTNHQELRKCTERLRELQ